MATYIGKGLVKDEVKMTGNAFFVQFEISVVPANQEDIVSMAAKTLSDSQTEISGS